MKTTAVIRLLCIAATSLLMVATTPMSAATTSESLKVLTCNIRQPMPEDDKTGDGWPARRELCADVIGAQHADIVCLQECRGYQLTYLKDRLPELDSYGLSHPEAEFTPANAILYSRSRFELITAGGFWLSETPHIAGTKSWDSARPRFANWAQLKDRRTGCEFRVWNTHLDHLGQTAREQQAQMVVQASAVFRALPQVLTADCNADTTNPAVEKLRAGGWADTYAAVHGPDDPGFTFHAFRGPKRLEGKPGAKIPGKIDWIMCRGPVKVLDADVIRDDRNGRYPSDHYFVSATVVLSPGSPASTTPRE
jgi:endonuclease/exonuclease/phosphatase family metal-dependent hydrolase